MHDLAIVGGGPAGCSAAITAARAGARVILIERGRFPRHKVCGEFVSAESLSLLASLLDAERAAMFQQAIRICEGRMFLDGRVLRAPVAPPAASIARLDLDSALWFSAIQAGVEAREQTTVQSFAGDGPFQLETSAGRFEARCLIQASGRWSNLNIPAVAQNQRERWLGIKAHFAEDNPPRSVDLYFFEGGYCGVQPVELAGSNSGRGRVNACAMVRADLARTLPEVFARHPALEGRSRNWEPLSEPVSTSPLIFHAPRPVRSNVLLAGDAAGFVDPFVGDGISLALRSGALSAESLIPVLAGKSSLTDAARGYYQSYQQRFAPVFHNSSRIRRMLLLPRGLRRPILAMFEAFPAMSRYLVKKTR
jgi:flavin-dependent dehydrogenase